MSQQAKQTVIRFNREVIERRNSNSDAFFDPDFINHSAPPESDNGAAGVLFVFNEVLRPAIADLRVHIVHQTAENDLVSTFKRFVGTHQGELLGIQPSQGVIEIEVMDVVRIRDGRYLEHWGLTNLPDVLQSLTAKGDSNHD